MAAALQLVPNPTEQRRKDLGWDKAVVQHSLWEGLASPKLVICGFEQATAATPGSVSIREICFGAQPKTNYSCFLIMEMRSRVQAAVGQKTLLAVASAQSALPAIVRHSIYN